MPKIRKPARVRKRKNPYTSVEDLLTKLSSNKNVKNIRIAGKGTFAIVFYFELMSRTFILNDIFLNKGEYAVKYIYGELQEHEKYLLKKISNYGLIPKIYYIDNKIIIMKYINGITFKEYKKIKSIEEIRKINRKIDILIKIWSKVGFTHYDLNDKNIIITPEERVYFIDPF
jgi:predicted Ser/Thr protein kinase